MEISAPSLKRGFTRSDFASRLYRGLSLKTLLISEGARSHILLLKKRLPKDLNVLVMSIESFRKRLTRDLSKYSFIVFDSLSNTENILDLIKETRKNKPCGLSVIAFTTNIDIDIVKIIESGADECIDQAMSVDQISARLLSKYRAHTLSENPRSNSIIVFKNEKYVVVNGEPVMLSHKEMALARVLLNRAGQTISREELCLTVWGKDKATVGRSLDVHVSKIREKLFIDSNAGPCLVSVYGTGYRLNIN